MKEFISNTMNISLDIKERAAVYHIVKPLEVAMALTNDYFSYPKEKALPPHNGPRNIVNAVPILMAQYAISEDDALALIKQKILEAEEEHRVELEKLEQKGLLPQELKRYIMACRMATSGSHFWHASTPRYMITRTNRNSRSPGRTIVSQFWNWMGSAL
jgi:ophiobolin F synthase